MDCIKSWHNPSNYCITHETITAADIDLIYSWQLIPDLRKFSLVKNTPTYSEHKEWFASKINNTKVIFQKILCDNIPCGVLRLDDFINHWILSWYILPMFQNKGIGTIALGFAKNLAMKKNIHAFVLKDNIASHKAMVKSGFKMNVEEEKGVWYVFP
jgi:RimJ/RimL family protein N-acetyltransferase